MRRSVERTTSVQDFTRVELRWAVVWLLVLEVAGLVMVGGFRARSMANADETSHLFFVRVFALSEGWAIGALMLFTLVAAVLCWQATAAAGEPPDAPGTPDRSMPWGLALLSMAGSIAAAFLLTEKYPLSMDEYVMRAQAALFAEGKKVAAVSDAVRALDAAARPIFVMDHLTAGGWISGYSPGYSALLAPFERFGVSWLANPMLNAASVLAILVLARSHWPGDRQRQLFSVVGLALCSQVLATGATNYAMPAHLALNLWWLVCLRRSDATRYLAGPIGAFALLLHQPVPHALFAAPFLWRELRRRNWTFLTAVAPFYVASLLGVVTWARQFAGSLPPLGPDGVIWFPQTANVIVLLMNTILMLSWQTPLIGFALVIGARRASRLDEFERDLLAGILLSLAFYLTFQMVTQGHGWGWRYGHQVLGNVVLVAASSWPAIRTALGARRALLLAWTSVAITLLVQFPLRAQLVRNFTMPFATAQNWIRSIPADVVIIPTDSVWYGRDLVRNANGDVRPLVLNGAVLRLLPGVLENFRQPSTSIKVVSVDELVSMGMERTHQQKSRD